MSGFLPELGHPVQEFLLPASRACLLYMLSYILIVYLIYRHRRSSASFIQFIFPAAIYKSSQFLFDIAFFYGISLFVFAVNSFLASHAHIVHQSVFYRYGWGEGLCLSIVFFLAFDFIAFAVHAMQHHIPMLWRFHALHHQQQHLHPLVAFKHHPMDMLVQILTYGLVSAVLLHCSPVFAGIFYEANPFILMFYALGYHLRHSHIPLHYPEWLSFLISPTQHQLHHSQDPAYYNKNLGFALSFWDRLFGSLYIPQGQTQKAIYG